MSAQQPVTKEVRAHLGPRDEENLASVAVRAGVSENAAIRQALATEAFVQQTLREGGSILVKDASGRIREVDFVPR